MASVHRQPGRPFWYGAYTGPDGVRHFRSTRTKNKKEAQQVCRAWEKAAREARVGRLTPERAREVIAEGVADVFTAANQEALPSATIKSWCERWLSAKTIETEKTTQDRYTRVVERFLAFLGKRVVKDVVTLKADDVLRFRDQEAVERSRATANLSVKVLRVVFGGAHRHGLLSINPAAKVAILKSRGEAKRRAFTVPELQRVLAACSDDKEWRGLVLFGLYTGQRLGDLARLTWRQINAEREEIAFTARKTGRRMVLPLVPTLLEYLTSLEASDTPDASLFPESAKATRTGTLSNRFYEILVDAGLAPKRSHSKRATGRDTKREPSPLTFHSLRHSAVTLLKAAGVSNALAMEIVGHETEAISRGYTHISTDDLRREMAKLPDLTPKEK